MQDAANIPMLATFSQRSGIRTLGPPLADPTAMRAQLCFYSVATEHDIDAIRNTKCQGQNLMLACRQTDSQTIKLLAWAPRADVFFDVGRTKRPSHIAQGSNWYFSDTYSWGFAKEGSNVKRRSCDMAKRDKDMRLCWHTNGNMGGWQCGSTTTDTSDAWEKL